MLNYFRDRKGQGLSTEYVVIFFAAVTAFTLMSIYVRRALQARAYDVKKFAIAAASEAYGNAIPQEYEPYYLQSDANSILTSKDHYSAVGGGPLIKEVDLSRNVISVADQFQPALAR